MLHRNRNYIIEDSLFADNNVNVDVDRTDGVLVRRTKIIGESESYRYAFFAYFLTVQFTKNTNSRSMFLSAHFCIFQGAHGTSRRRDNLRQKQQNGRDRHAYI